MRLHTHLGRGVGGGDQADTQGRKEQDHQGPGAYLPSSAQRCDPALSSRQAQPHAAQLCYCPCSQPAVPHRPAAAVKCLRAGTSHQRVLSRFCHVTGIHAHEHEHPAVTRVVASCGWSGVHLSSRPWWMKRHDHAAAGSLSHQNEFSAVTLCLELQVAADASLMTDNMVSHTNA